MSTSALEQTAKPREEYSNYLLNMEGVTKTFSNGKVCAVDDVDFYVKHNEVVGLLGDNGAGKSTLIKLINGFHIPDKGKIYFEGERVKFHSPKEARDTGIETAYQNLALVNLLNISRNFFMGRELQRKVGPLTFLDKKKMNEISAEFMSEVGLENIRDMNQSVNFLSGGERQAISIGRAHYFGARLLILDEPTAALSVMETEWVLSLVEQAKNRGLSVILITHNAYEAYGVSDRFVVLRHGKNYANINKEDTEAKELVEIIAGRSEKYGPQKKKE
jgi:simple sugar transport system ATP-binding protein